MKNIWMQNFTVTGGGEAGQLGWGMKKNIGQRGTSSWRRTSTQPELIKQMISETLYEQYQGVSDIAEGENITVSDWMMMMEVDEGGICAIE